MTYEPSWLWIYSKTHICPPKTQISLHIQANWSVLAMHTMGYSQGHADLCRLIQVFVVYTSLCRFCCALAHIWIETVEIYNQNHTSAIVSIFLHKELKTLARMVQKLQEA